MHTNKPYSSPKSWDEDKLDRQPFAAKFERFIQVEHDFVPNSLVVSLEASFGSGKTAFLELWKNDLDKRRKTDTSIPKTIVLNAWESDYLGDPFVAITLGLMEALEADESDAGNKKAAKFREALKDVGWFFVGLANQAGTSVSSLLGVKIDALAAGKVAEEKKKARKPEEPDFFTSFKKKQTALQNLKSAMAAVFGGEFPTAYILVDELDRCRPDYAISYLETIKHLFDVHGLVFVLAVDLGQLACSAKALFGNDLKFQEYFRKFSHSTMPLPPLELKLAEKICAHYIELFIRRSGKRETGLDASSYKRFPELANGLKLVPRQITDSFRTAGHILSISNKNTTTPIYPWAFSCATILLCMIRAANQDYYLQLKQSAVELREFAHYLKKSLGINAAAWWLGVWYSGSTLFQPPLKGFSPGDEFKKILAELGYDRSLSDDLGGYAGGWGTGSLDLKSVFQKIDENAPIDN